MSQTYGTAPAAIGGAGEGAQPTPGGPLSYIHWGPVVGGALVAARSVSLGGYGASQGVQIATKTRIAMIRMPKTAKGFLSSDRKVERRTPLRVRAAVPSALGSSSC